jgi:hypothetical protein
MPSNSFLKHLLTRSILPPASNRTTHIKIPDKKKIVTIVTKAQPSFASNFILNKLQHNQPVTIPIFPSSPHRHHRHHLSCFIIVTKSAPIVTLRHHIATCNQLKTHCLVVR